MTRLFTEDEDHKPKLDVVLEKSVGENMKFTIEASGFKKESFSYEGISKVRINYIKHNFMVSGDIFKAAENLFTNTERYRRK